MCLLECAYMCVYICEALGSCAHIVAVERTAHGDLTTDMCIPAFEWTADAVVQAIEEYAELQELKSDQDCSR